MAPSAERLVDALGGLGGALPPRGVLHVVAVPRFDPTTTSLRAAVTVAAADVVRRPPELPPDVLGPLVDCPVVDGTIRELDPATLDLAGRRVVQLVATASQTAPVVVEEVGRLRTAGVPVVVIGSLGEVEATLIAGGIGRGVARSGSEAVLDQIVLAADRPDPAAWARVAQRRGYLGHTPVVLVERAATPQQRATVMQLRDLAGRASEGPVVVVVGDDVVGPVDWRGDLSLRGVTVSNHRAPHQAPALTARLRDRGASVVEAPLLDTVPGDTAAMDGAVARCAAGAVELLCLTSPNGAVALGRAVGRAGLDARALAPVARIACVGPGTAAALRATLCVDADLVAPVHTTAGLGEAVGAPRRTGAVALLPRADLATAELRDLLDAAGWQVEEVVAYRTVSRDLDPGVAEAMASGVVELVPVLSSSMARALVAAGRRRGIRGAVVSIGPITSATLREAGVEPITEADPHDLDGLVAAVERAAGQLGSSRG